MRRAIAGLIAGLVLGTATTAGAASIYWVRGGNSYTCTGIGSGVTCKDHHGSFNVAITSDYVGIFRGNKPVYGCERGYDTTLSACFGD